MNDDGQDGAAKARFGGVLLALLALSIFINYVDRGNLATAAPLIRGELQLSNAEYGILVSAFFWVYVPGQLLAAWLVRRLNAYRTLALGLALWSAATVASGFATGFAMLLMLRVLLGIGESAGFPASSQLLAENLPPERLGKANGLVCSGIYFGPAFGTFLGGLIIAQAGWRALFISFGALSFLWLVPWVMRTRSLSRAALTQRADEPSFRELLANRQLWGASIGHFCANYPLYLVLSWLPLYLVKSQGFSLETMAQLGGVVYGIATLFCLGGGWLADRCIAAGADQTRVRLGMMCSTGLIWFACMLACAFGSAQAAIIGLLVSSAAMGMGGLNLYTIAQTLAGPRASGKWMGIQNAVGNLAGIVAPVVTGTLIDWTGRYNMVFLVAGFVALVGTTSWLLLVRRVSPIHWPGGPPATSPAVA